MCVLSAIFSDAGDVPFYIAGIQIRLIERRIQELNQGMLPVNEALIYGFHCHARAFSIPGTG